MTEYLPFIRTLHVLSAGLWLGEVAVINFILIPAFARLEGETRKKFLIVVFPRVFKLASIFSATAIITGSFLLGTLVQGDLRALFQGRWGWSILIGGSLGIILTVFHFFLEQILAKKLGFNENISEDAMAEFHIKLKIVPRLGLIIITVIFLLMINASRGIF